MANQEEMFLYGRLFITFNIRLMTGLRIGGSEEGIQIGGIDNTVIRNPFNNQPYIPGSSLRGKMRCELDKAEGKSRNHKISENVSIHICKKQEDYVRCNVCMVFGVPGAMPGEKEYGGPTRLLVRDVALTEASRKALENARLDMPFTEIKTEAAIDRVTSAAVPRPMERVPAGAVFGPAELVFNVYGENDFALLQTVVKGLQLVEDSYLGGGGSRGNGRVRFEKFEIQAKRAEDYTALPQRLWEGSDIRALTAALDEVIGKARAFIPVE